MAKLFKWLMVLFIPLFSLTLTSCGDDDKDEPDIPTDINIDMVIVPWSGGRVCMNFPVKNRVDIVSHGGTIEIDGHDIYNHLSYVFVKDAKSIHDIVSIPSIGWSESTGGYNQSLSFDYKEGGYILRNIRDGQESFIRFYLTTNKDVTGDIIGLKVSWNVWEYSN